MYNKPTLNQPTDCVVVNTKTLFKVCSICIVYVVVPISY